MTDEYDYLREKTRIELFRQDPDTAPHYEAERSLGDGTHVSVDVRYVDAAYDDRTDRSFHIVNYQFSGNVDDSVDASLDSPAFADTVADTLGDDYGDEVYTLYDPRADTTELDVRLVGVDRAEATAFAEEYLDLLDSYRSTIEA